MPDNNNQLNFTNLNFSEDQENDNQQNYNPISGITKVESLEFDFEPDEDIENEEEQLINSNFRDYSEEEKRQYKQSDQVQIAKNINEPDLTETDISSNESEEDVLLIPENINETVISNLHHIQNINFQSDNEKTSENISDEQLNNEYFKFDNDFDTDNEFNQTFDNISDDTEDILKNLNIAEDEISNYNSEITDVHELYSEQDDILNYNEEQVDIDNYDENDEEDILAEVLAQDYTLPVEGFEEFAKRKKIREEASKVLDGENYQQIEFDSDNKDDKQKENSDKKSEEEYTDDFEDDFELEINDFNDENLFDDKSLDFHSNIDSDQEEESDDDYELSLNNNIDFNDIDITDIPDIGYEEDKNSIEELLEQENDDAEEFSEQDFDYDISQDIEENISNNEENDNEIELDEINESEDEFFNNEEDDFFYGDIENKVDDGSYDDGGFQIGFGDDSEEDEEDEDFFETDFDDFDLEDISNETFEEDISSDNMLLENSDNELSYNSSDKVKKVKDIINSIPGIISKLITILKKIPEYIKVLRLEIKEYGFKAVVIRNSTTALDKIKEVNTKTKKSILNKFSAKKNSESLVQINQNNNENKENNNWGETSTADNWGLGPSESNIEIEKQQENNNSAWEDEEEESFEDEFSFSTADMLMEDDELGLGEFGRAEKEDNFAEEEDATNYNGIIGKVKKIRKVIFRWVRLIYKYFDGIFDFEKNWWKIIDFVAVIVLTMSMAMVVAYYIWHK